MLTISDPLLQLNVILWASMPAPTAVEAYQPVLFRRGFVLAWLGKKISLLPDMSLKVQQLTEDQKKGFGQNANPDVFLKHRKYPGFIIECKSNSFACNSTTARQARVLLTCAPRTAEYRTLGMGNGTHVAYCLPDEVVSLQKTTLENLHSELDAQGWKLSPNCLFSLSRSEEGITLKPETCVGPPHPALSAWSTPEVVLGLAPDDDLTPLLLVPWEPSATSSAQEEERNREFLAHKLGQGLVSRIGSAPLGRLDISISDLLNLVTSSMFKYWDKDIQGRYRKAVIQQVIQIAKEASVHCSTFPDQDIVRVDITDSSRKSFLAAISPTAFQSVDPAPIQLSLPV